MEPQKPTIGRIVHYNSQHGDNVVQEAAMIVAVHSDTTVTLVTWNAGGTSTTRRSIPFGSPEKSGTWCWPARV